MYFTFKSLVLLFVVYKVNDATSYSSHTDSEGDDRVVFPGNTRYRDVYKGKNFNQHGRNQHNNENSHTDSSLHSEIPLNFILKLNEIHNVTDLLLNYVEGQDESDGGFLVASRFGNVERAAATVPKPARCIPTLQTVELKNSNDSGLFYIPACTRVERCGGCCSHSLLSCQPTQTETLSFQVIATKYEGGSKLNFKGKEIVLVEQHKKCKCDCIMKQEDCNVFQEYRKDECRCICTNLDERKKCEKNNDTKLWDPSVCKCKCREINECSTGFFFDQNKCICTRIPIRRRFAEINSSQERQFYDEERYDVEPMSVVPITKSNKST